jgi:UDP-N-acetylmuramate--alanine ligase
MKSWLPFKHIHLVGIGGAGMSAIAQVLLYNGYNISGSDPSNNQIIAQLKEEGAVIYSAHEARNILGADLVATSTAIPPDNPEKTAAEKSGIPVWHRARVLAEIMRAGKSVAVSGTHGKTTTTSMLGQMLVSAGLDPTVLIGGWLNVFNGNARTGSGDWVIAEADESDASFLQMTPDRVIITNIEADHLDYYADLDAIMQAFEEFIGNMNPGGRVIACMDDPGVRELIGKTGLRDVVGFGIENREADLWAGDIHPVAEGAGNAFNVTWKNRKLGPVWLGVPGKHNVMNALASLAAGLDMGAEFEPMVDALREYHGAKRRFQFKGELENITVVDDYAHHPTEVVATLDAARTQVASGKYHRIVVVFQPHRYSRTQHLQEGFAQALLGCGVLVVSEVYSAGEDPIEGVSGRHICEMAKGMGHPEAWFAETLDDVRQLLHEHARSGDLVLTMGAGNIFRAGEEFLADLETGILIAPTSSPKS